MRTIALQCTPSTLDQAIHNHARYNGTGWTDVDATSNDPADLRANNLAERLTDLTSAVLELFEDLAVDVEVVVAQVVRFTASVLAKRPLTHVDELLDDLHTMSSYGMTTGDAAIDELLAMTVPRY